MSNGDSCFVIKAGWYLVAHWVQQCAITNKLNFHLRANAGRDSVLLPWLLFVPIFVLCVEEFSLLKFNIFKEILQQLDRRMFYSSNSPAKLYIPRWSYNNWRW